MLIAVKTKKILIIDDDEINIFIFNKTLSKCNFESELKSFTNPINALSYIADTNNECDLIFLDLHLPEMSGEDFIHHFNQTIERNIPIVIVTSSIDELLEQKIKTLPNVKDFLSKPITVEKIQAMV